MAINTALLVAAPMLQDYIVDKTTGTPLAGGFIYLWVDTARYTTFKNWYYQTGTPGNYSYITLDNPLQLSAVGTIQDPNGNDVIPFFYPFNEDNQDEIQTYFVEVYANNGNNQPGILQFTRSNFPFTPTEPAPGVVNATLRNYLVNNEFWRPAGTYSTSTGAYTVDVSAATPTAPITIAPSQHDGFNQPDMVFVKDVGDGTDIITFTKFSSDDNLIDDVQPEYYINYTCSNPGTSTYKYIQIPISLHQATLSGIPNCTLTIQANNISGNPINKITMNIYQYDGSGTSSSQTIEKYFLNATLNWVKYGVGGAFVFTMPSVFEPAARTLGTGGDDAFYLQIGFPAGNTFNLNIAKPAFYVSDVVPTNDFDTYDEIDAVISSPRTGDVRISANTFAPFGWVPMNDGTIGDSASHATTRASIDTWPLFNLLWSQFSPGTGNPGTYINMFTSSATLPYTVANWGATAIADWNANRQLQLPRTLGRMLVGAASSMPNAVFPVAISFSTNSSTTFTVTAGSLVNVIDGMPVRILTYGGAGNPRGHITYYIQVLSASTFKLYQGFANGGTLTLTGGGTFFGVITAGSSNTGTLIIPDDYIGAINGANWGDSSGDIESSTGYPVGIYRGGNPVDTAITVRNPSTYMNFFIKL